MGKIEWVAMNVSFYNNQLLLCRKPLQNVIARPEAEPVPAKAGMAISCVTGRESHHCV